MLGEHSMKCPNCDEEIPGEESVCPHCGSLIDEHCYDAIADEEDEHG